MEWEVEGSVYHGVYDRQLLGSWLVGILRDVVGGACWFSVNFKLQVVGCSID